MFTYIRRHTHIYAYTYIPKYLIGINIYMGTQKWTIREKTAWQRFQCVVVVVVVVVLLVGAPSKRKRRALRW